MFPTSISTGRLQTVIGNPRFAGNREYTWQAGRQLCHLDDNGIGIAYSYNSDGLRVQKVVNGDWYPQTYKYTYHGKLLTHLTVDYTDFDEVAQQDTFHFFYDAQSRPAMVKYNGTMYTYVHNLQGDIVAILNASGTKVVEYKYDVWGNPIAMSGSMLSTLGMRNPFRYRGYVYDYESGLYYLRSRYYDPVVGRFVNADNIIPSGNRALIQNCYTYCRNNPGSLFDSEGKQEDSFVPDNIIYWGDANSINVNTILFYYVPDQQNISELIIGHFEIGLEYNGWLIYSFGPGERIVYPKEDVYRGMLRVKEEANWHLQRKDANYSRYAIGFYSANELISFAIDYMARLCGKSDALKPGNYYLDKNMGDGTFAKYSLNRKIGEVCRSFAEVLLYILGHDIMSTKWASNNSAYYPYGFHRAVQDNIHEFNK